MWGLLDTAQQESTGRFQERVPVSEGAAAAAAWQVFFLRSMLAVPYFEKALYELPEERVTPAELAALADDVERRIQGGLAGRCGQGAASRRRDGAGLRFRVYRSLTRLCRLQGWCQSQVEGFLCAAQTPEAVLPLVRRPLLAVPHILADESSAYYHGYVLAEMSVHQTREFFKSKYGSIADNPEVGKQLTDVRAARRAGRHPWAPRPSGSQATLCESHVMRKCDRQTRLHFVRGR